MAEYIKIPTGLASKVAKKMGKTFNQVYYQMKIGNAELWEVGFQILEEEKVAKKQLLERLSRLGAA